METPEFIPLEKNNPWLQIWFHPRKMLASRLTSDPKKAVLWLALLNGCISGLIWVMTLWNKYPLREEHRKWTFGSAIVVGGAISGVISLYLGAWLYRLTGRWLKGKGNFTEIKCAVGWSCYPYFIAGIFNLLNALTLSIPFLGLGLGLLFVILFVWAFILSLKLLGEAHQFSAWRALATMLLAAVLVFVVVMIGMLLVPLLQPLFVHQS